MTIENDPSARIQVRSMGELRAPGTCYVCGSGTCESGYVDFGTFVDYHGNFYLCMTCAQQVADVIGYYSPEEVLTQEGIAADIAQKNLELEKSLEEARNVIDSLNTLLRTKLYAGTDGFVNVVPEPAEANDSDANPFDGSTERSTVPAKSVKGPRRGNANGPFASNAPITSDSSD